jgi:hypothetical protein
VKHSAARAQSTHRWFGAAALTLLAALVLLPAHAQQGERGVWRGNKEPRELRQQLREERRQQRQEQFRERLRDADENQDRALNRDEAQKHFPRLGKRFDDIDGNRDGIITRDEVRAFRDARAKARIWAGEGNDPRD